MDKWAFIILTVALSVMDMAYTYTNVKILKEHNAKWGNTEYNPLVRSSWHLFGLLGGTLFAGLITLTMIFCVAYAIGEREFFQGALIGVFIMIHHLHYVNYAYISKKYLKREPSFLARIMTEW